VCTVVSIVAVTEKPRRRIAFPLGAAGDERLATLVGEGHDRAFAAIYARYHQRLYRYCMTMLRNDADAQDALQSAFTAAYAALSESRRSAPLRPWLFRIAHNEAISLLRRRRGEATLSEVAESEDVGVEEQAGRRAELQLLIADLRELPERQRAALVMRELSGLSHEEIALALEVSTAAAKQTIFEARKSLMEFTAGREMSCDEIRLTLSDGDGRAARARRVRGHLSTCAGCAEFAAQIRRRRVALRAITPPLPALIGQQLLGRVLRASGAHGGGASAGAGAGGVAGVAGKLSATAVGTKAIAGVAIVASAGAGVGVLRHALRHAPPQQPTHATRVLPAGSPAASRDGSVGRVITVRAHGAAAAGRGTAREVHRLRHGFWAPKSAVTKPSAGAGARAPAAVRNSTGASHANGGAGHAYGLTRRAGTRSAPGRVAGHGGGRGAGVVRRHSARGHVAVPARPFGTGTAGSAAGGSGRGLASGHATAPGLLATSPGAHGVGRTAGPAALGTSTIPATAPRP
jgi:RNA polymerase sigma factor (sigma-70 family)